MTNQEWEHDLTMARACGIARRWGVQKDRRDGLDRNCSHAAYPTISDFTSHSLLPDAETAANSAILSFSQTCRAECMRHDTHGSGLALAFKGPMRSLVLLGFFGPHLYSIPLPIAKRCNISKAAIISRIRYTTQKDSPLC